MDTSGSLHSCDLAFSIKVANPDLLLHLGQCELPADAVSCAPMGAWFLQESDMEGATKVPGQFWDLYDGNCEILHGPRIIERTGNQSRILYRSCGVNNRLSLALNQHEAYWNLAEYLAGELSQISRSGVDAKVSVSVPVASRSSHSRILGNTSMAGFLVRLAKRIFVHKLRKKLFREQWRLALQPAPGTRYFGGAEVPQYIQPTADRFYADPFLIEKNGRTFLFFEDYRFATQKGLISCCEVDAMGNRGEPRVVLECPYHLSYPFLFEWQGEIRLIPETRDNRTIEMYKAENFPYSWTREAVLMSDVGAADSTLLQYQGKWWLFTAGIQDHASPNQFLFLYYAESPKGPWTAHPKNPIVSDPRRARPAGNLYFENGRLIRPGQDCSRSYGYAVQLNRVNVLTETDYWEEPLTRITPSQMPGSLGIHTMNQSMKHQVIDAMFMLPRFQFSSLFMRWLIPANQRDPRGMHTVTGFAPRDAISEAAKLLAREGERKLR